MRRSIQACRMPRLPCRQARTSGIGPARHVLAVTCFDGPPLHTDGGQASQWRINGAAAHHAVIASLRRDNTHLLTVRNRRRRGDLHAHQT
jgi:hypothetical protein